MGLATAAAAIGCGPENGSAAGAVRLTGTGSTAQELQKCSPQTLEGVDVFDGTGFIDWKAVKADGVDFAIIKATQGTYNTQSRFALNWRGAKDAGVYRSAYHFFDPTEDGSDQARHFLAVVSPEPGDLPAMLDIECPDGDPKCLGWAGATGDVPSDTLQQRMWDFVDTVERATAKKPIIYTFNAYFSSLGIAPAGLQDYPLDIAYPASGSCFDVPSPWTKATIWQYTWTGSVTGIEGEVDRDRFLGTMGDLQALGSAPSAPSWPTLPNLNGNDALTILNSPVDGHAEVFVATASGRIEDVSTRGNSENWDPAVDRGSGRCHLASATWGAEPEASASLFDAVVDGAQAEMWTSGQWSSFVSLGGPALEHLTAVSAADGHVEVYGLAPDGSIARSAQRPGTTAWDRWTSLGGTFVTGAAPIVWSDGRIELFATDAQGGAWHDWTDGAAWDGWAAIDGGPLASRPTPIRWADGHVEIFALGIDAHVWHSSGIRSSFPAFARLDTSVDLSGEISAIVNPGGMGAEAGPEIFARTTSGGPVHMAWTGTSWTPWVALPSLDLASDPVGWVRTGGMGEVFAVDSRGNLAKTYRAPDGTWTPWGSIASGVDACLAGSAVARDGGIDGNVADDAAAGSDAIGESEAAPAQRLVLYDAGPPVDVPPSRANGETEIDWWAMRGPTQVGTSTRVGCEASGRPTSPRSSAGIALLALLAARPRHRRLRAERGPLRGLS
jgi:lysozyme